MSAGQIISLSLISHTNVGKTSLARTLLGRDIGVVRDEAHVTEVAEAHTLVETPVGDRLILWDTPGFGDSARLARRLAAAGEPIGWFVTQVWDRLRDRALWASQQAVRNVREQADVVLYLVNAAEPTGQAPYIDDEMRILDWIGKPVIVLLNQLGAPRSGDADSAELAQWRNRLAHAHTVRAVLTLDAFARCWVQEATLLRTIATALPAQSAAAWQRLFACWLQRRRIVFDESVDILARALARTATDREAVPEAGLVDRLRDATQLLVRDRKGDEPGTSAIRRRAMDALARRLDEDLRAATDRVIRLHDLDGRAQAVIFERLATHYHVDAGMPEGRAAVLGSIVTGAVAGLKADLATGGLSLGAGMLGGGLLGALGAFGLARGYNLVRGTTSPAVRWSEEALQASTVAVILSYLAVAHYGRGRGDWVEAESPPHWRTLVQATLERRHEDFRHVWSLRDGKDVHIDRHEDDGPAGFVDLLEAAGSRTQGNGVRTETSGAFVDALRAALGAALLDVLEQLYPDGVRDSGLLDETADVRRRHRELQPGESGRTHAGGI